MTDDEETLIRDQLAAAQSLIRVHRLIWSHVNSHMPKAAKAIDDLDYLPTLFDDELWGGLHTFMTVQGLDEVQREFLRAAPVRLSQLAARMNGCDKSYFLRHIKIVNAIVQHMDQYGNVGEKA